MALELSVLTAVEVYSRSFGAVKTLLSPPPRDWRNLEATLLDPKIFGPAQAWSCACGKYRGEEHESMVCDICGVKILGDSDLARHTRWGHIKLAGSIGHPLLPGKAITAIPVLPLSYRSNRGDSDLDHLYENVIKANAETAQGGAAGDHPAQLARAFAALCHNEAQPEPIAIGGWVLRSLAARAFPEDYGVCELEDAPFLFAMALAVKNIA